MMMTVSDTCVLGKELFSALIGRIASIRLDDH